MHKGIWVALFLFFGLSQSLTATEIPRRVLIFFEEVEDLSQAYQIENRNERRQYVFNQLSHQALQEQKRVRDFLDKKAQAYRAYYISNMILLLNPSRELVRELQNYEEIVAISLDPVIPLDRVPEQTERQIRLFQTQSALSSTGALRVWQQSNSKGEGVVVGIQDTGVDWTHPYLKNQYRGSENNHIYHWHDAVRERVLSRANPCGYGTLEPCDDDGHGTHVTGSIAGELGIGMAPESKWIACRNMDQGEGRPSLYIECYQFLFAPHPSNKDPFVSSKPELGADIINNSWGCPLVEGCKGFEMDQVFRALHAAGVANVVAAGNSGPSCASVTDIPATHSEFNIVVGAHDHRWGGIAYFSSRGPSRKDSRLVPHLTAPGVNIVSSLPGGKLGPLSGTSMAAPHVSGAIALLWGQESRLKGHVEESLDLILTHARGQKTSDACGELPIDAIPNHTYGYGHLDIWKVFENLK